MGRSVARMGCHRAKGAHRRTPSISNSCRGPGSERIRAFFVYCGSLFDLPNLCPTGAHRGARTADRSLTICFRFSISWRVCFGTTASMRPTKCGAAGMCAAGTPASCSETALRWPGAALALEHNRDEMNNKPSSSSRFEGGNRPQRLGGTGTRHRNLHGGVAQLEEQLPCTQQVAGSMPVTSTKFLIR